MTSMRHALLSLLTLLCISGPLTAQAPASPYLILISFDGFRWDYGDRGLTPNLQKLADTGVRALTLKPVYPSKTFPNHYSIVTGMYAENHGLIANNFDDPFKNTRYSNRDTTAVRDGKWYLGEAFWETAERQGVRCASYFWPGSELDLDYRRPTYYQQYVHDRVYAERVMGVLAWLALPEKQRPRFITLYFDAVDTQGHRYGPDAPETNQAIALVDSMLGLLMAGVERLGLAEQMNYIVVSDHGMTPVDNEHLINVAPLLGEIECDFEDRGPIMFVTPKSHSVQETAERLRRHAKHFRVLTRDTMPDFLHFSASPLIPPIVLMPELGWQLISDVQQPMTYKGNHGYENHLLDMHGIFYAAGPAFRRGYRTGTLNVVDIYPMLCRIFDVMPRQNIDGELQRIGYVLQGW